MGDKMVGVVGCLGKFVFDWGVIEIAHNTIMLTRAPWCHHSEPTGLAMQASPDACHETARLVDKEMEEYVTGRCGHNNHNPAPVKKTS